MNNICKPFCKYKSCTYSSNESILLYFCDKYKVSLDTIPNKCIQCLKDDDKKGYYNRGS